MPAEQSLVAVVMAAGKGTRMRSRLPKVLHPIAGEPLIAHVLLKLPALGAGRRFVILGHGADQVRAVLPEGVIAVMQHEQLGTGHAVDQVRPHLEGFEGSVLILSGDVPLLSAETLQALLAVHQREEAALTFLTTELADPTGYGRLLRDAEGRILGVVEQKDASEAQRAIREVNVGTYVCRWPLLQAALSRLSPENAQGEYYLTDAIGMLVAEGHRVSAHRTSDPTECRGINTRSELSELGLAYNQRMAAYWMARGVSVPHPDSTVIGPHVEFGTDVVLEPGVSVLGHCRIADGCVIGAHSQLRDVVLDESVHILNSHLDHAHIGAGSSVGPYAHLRQGARLGRQVRLGNFVEVKKSTLGDGVKAAHLAYLGDATLGADVNVGCGVITVNYDGVHKHPTVIEAGAFVGSNSNLIAPVRVGTHAFVAAGSTITEDVPDWALAIGRGRQVIKEGWAARRQAPERT